MIGPERKLCRHTTANRGWIACALGLVFATLMAAAAAAETGPGRRNVITQERLEAAKSLMVAMGAERRFSRIVRVIADRLSAAMKHQHARHADAIDAAYKVAASRFAHRGMDAIALIAPLYAEKFTTDELRQALAFYHSPLGRKMVATEPEIVRRSQSLGAVWGGRIGRQMQQHVLAELAGRGIILDKTPKPRN